MRKLRIDPILLIIFTSLVLAIIAPVSGGSAEVLEVATTIGIFLLFFGYGARLSAAEALAGFRNWRLHLSILAVTFILYPAIGLALGWLPEALLQDPIRLGLIFMCLVPSTVQSSITFTSLAGGNVASAIVAATTSNVLGVVLTPLLVVLLIPGASGEASIGIDQFLAVFVQLLLPFLLGQLSRRFTAKFMADHRSGLKIADQSVIFLIVYGAFSELNSSGIWRQLKATDLILVLAIVCLMLALMFWLTWALGGWLGFTRADRIALLFCGTKKSLATGLPIASVLFPASLVSVLIIPLMFYHQLQLVVSSAIASRLRRATPGQDPTD